MTVRPLFQCKACKKPYIREVYLLKHKCEKMRREEEIRTAIGRQAWELYRLWMHRSGRRILTIDSFLASALYSCFIRFAKYVKEIGLAHPDKFVELMVKQDYMPSMWLSREVYTLYIEEYDQTVNPGDQVADSVHTIDNFCEDKNILTSEFFGTVSPAEIIHLLRKKKLSPWLILRSKKFVAMFNEKFTPEQKAIASSFLNVVAWKKKFKKDAEFVHGKVDVIVRGLGL